MAGDWGGGVEPERPGGVGHRETRVGSDAGGEGLKVEVEGWDGEASEGGEGVHGIISIFLVVSYKQEEWWGDLRTRLVQGLRLFV